MILGLRLRASAMSQNSKPRGTGLASSSRVRAWVGSLPQVPFSPPPISTLKCCRFAPNFGLNM